MNHERLARTNGLIGEGESYSKPPSFVVLQNSDEIEIEHDEVQPPPQIMRRPSSPPPIICRTWVLFVSCFIGIPAGSIYSWSVLMDDFISAKSINNWPRTCIPNTVSCLFCGYGIVLFLFGNMKKLRLMAVIAGLLTSIGYFICYWGLQMDRVYLFFLGGLVNGTGLGFSRLAFVLFVKSWFEYDVALVASWVGTVIALGGAIFSWGFRYFVDSQELNHDEQHALSQTFFWSGIVVGGMQLWGAFFIQINEQKDLYGETPYRDPITFKEMLRTTQFWQIFVVYFTNLAPMIGVLSVFASRIRHYGNINKVMASTYLAMLCLISAASRMCVRATARAVGPKFLAGCLNLGGAATFVFITQSLDSHSPPIMTLIWLIVANACFSASFGLIEELCVKIFGPRSGSSVYWRVSFAIPIAGIVGPSFISMHRDEYFREYCYGSAGLLLFGLIVLCTVTKVVQNRGYGSLT